MPETPRQATIRLVFLILSFMALAYCALTAWQLYTGLAPYHQYFSQATAAQNALVSKQMIIALLGLPLSLMAIVTTIAPPPIRTGRLVALVCVLALASFQGCAAWAFLPYGLDESDRHTPDQTFHWKFATSVGFIAFALVVVVLLGLLTWRITSAVLKRWAS